jgi:hypothetical protein
MTLKLYTQIVLIRDVPDSGLFKGDVATLIDVVAHPAQGEDGGVLEVFNVLGESIAVVTAPLSAIAPLSAEHIPTVRVRTG